MNWRSAFAIGVATSVSLYRLLAREPRVPPPHIQAAQIPAGAALAEVSFPASDGLGLSGWLLTPPRAWATLILCHGWYHNRLEPLQLGLGLCQRGYEVLLFDFRGCGRSQGRFSTAGLLETRDLEGAAGFFLGLPQSRTRPLGLVGISMGAAVVLMALGRGLGAAAVVVDSSFASLEQLVREVMRRYFFLRPFQGWGLGLHRRLFAPAPGGDVSPQSALAREPLPPALFIHGLGDNFIGPHHTGQLFEAYCGHKELWLAPGSAHGYARLDRPQEYQERVDSFFKAHLTAHRPTTEPWAVPARKGSP